MAKPNYELAAERAAKRAGINPRIFKAMIRAESDFNPNAGSTAGARGIAQFMPGTAPSYGVNLDDGLVTDDLNGAAKYIKEMLGKTGGNYHQALSMYNAGPGRPNGYKEIPETIAYVKKIMGGYKNERLQDGSSTPSTPSAPSSVPSVKTTKVTTPGIDNSGARAAAALQFLRSKSKDPVYLAQQVQGLQDTPAVTKTTTTGGSTGGTTGGAISAPDGTLAAKLTSRANAIDRKKMPYLWGGGHGGKVNAYKATPLDCSGAVSAVLGIDPRVSGEFTKWGKPGEGGTTTVYANDKHVLMKINGHFFGTSASNPGGGAGWIPQKQISKDYLKGFTARHI